MIHTVDRLQYSAAFIGEGPVGGRSGLFTAIPGPFIENIEVLCVAVVASTSDESAMT